MVNKEVFMQKVSRIMLPVAFSENDNLAADYARQLALCFDAEVVLIHVSSLDFLMGHQVPLRSIQKDSKDYEQEITDKLMKAFADKALSEVKVQHKVVLTGNTTSEILKYGRENNIQMIVLASHCRKGLEKMFVGSVAQQVVKKSHCPVLLVHPPCPSS